MAGLDAGADRPEAGGAIRQEAACDAMTETASPRLAHDGDAQMHLGRCDALRGRDRIEPRPQRRQRAQQIGQRRTRGGKCFQQVEQIGVGGFGAVLAFGQRAQRGGMARMRRGHGKQVQRAVERARDVQLVGQGLANRRIVGDPQRGQGRIDQRRIVRNGDAERIARRVGQPGVAQIDDDVANVLAGTWPGKGFDCDHVHLATGQRDWGLRCRRGGQRGRFGEQTLQCKLRWLGARHAQADRTLASLGQRRRIALAHVAALPAVELAHRRHQALRQCSAFGHGEPLRQFQHRIVPGEVLRRFHSWSGGGGNARGDGAVEAGQEAVQPRTLGG